MQVDLNGRIEKRKMNGDTFARLRAKQLDSAFCYIPVLQNHREPVGYIVLSAQSVY